ncbi:hypothetical protein MD484_g1678, partial [Candolleomyces efflorescens]
MSSLSSRRFTVQLHDEETGSQPRFARRVLVNPDVLKAAKLSTGDVVAVQSQAGKGYTIVGVVWASCEILPTNASISLSHLLTLRLQEGQSIRIVPLGGPTNPTPGLPSLKTAKDAKDVRLTEIPSSSSSSKAEKEKVEWLTLASREVLVDLKYISPDQVIQVTFEGRKRRFCVVSVKAEGEEDVVDDLARLSLDAPSEPQQIWVVGLKPPRGILLHGPPGTGKTHLARAIALSTRSSVLTINGPELSSAYHGETESKLRAVFQEAYRKSPCIVVLDEVDALVPRREEGAGGGEVEKRVVATLLTILDGMGGGGQGEGGKGGEGGEGRVVVVGTTNRPNAIDPALRRPGRFDREIEIGIPDAQARLSILKVLLAKTPHTISDEELWSIASRAHGYVGADLSAVVREAGTQAIKRYCHSLSPHSSSLSPPTLSSTSPQNTPPPLSLQDLLLALPKIQPSSLRSLIHSTPPPITFSSIGGQASIIQKLKEGVEWPLVHPEAFKRLGVDPPRGVLLYGPPGCSKTLLGRACAGCGVNYLVVRGPEDSALMRPGRLDRILYVGPPDLEGREEIIRIKMGKMSVGPDVDVRELAELTEGCSGAEISTMCQEAALETMRVDIGAAYVSQAAFVSAAKSIKRQITPAVLRKFEQWRDGVDVKGL